MPWPGCSPASVVRWESFWRASIMSPTRKAEKALMCIISWSFITVRDGRFSGCVMSWAVQSFHWTVYELMWFPVQKFCFHISGSLNLPNGWFYFPSPCQHGFKGFVLRGVHEASHQALLWWRLASLHDINYQHCRLGQITLPRRKRRKHKGANLKPEYIVFQ